MIGCREATFLLSVARERPLTWREQWALRVHLLTCRFCRRCAKEFQLLGVLLQRLAGTEVVRENEEHTLSPEGRHRIRGILKREAGGV